VFLADTKSLHELSDFDFGWLIGIVEGEGCFYCKDSKIKLSDGYYCYPLGGFSLMGTDFDVMERFSKLIRIDLRGPYYKLSKKERKLVWSVQVTGNRAVAIMNVLKPHLSQRRQEQIEAAIKWQNQGRFKLI